jgi:hypothetical protein
MVTSPPLPSFIEARYRKKPKNNEAGDINKCKSLLHRDSTAAVTLRPGISSQRRHNALLVPQRPEEQEKPEVPSSSFPHRSSPARSEIANTNCCTTFPKMLLKMLQDAESKDFENIVSWVPGQNNLFRVHDSERFTREIAPLYFKCTQYTSFQRQLNLYGFSRIKTGLHTGGYMHELLVRGNPELCDYIMRTKCKGKKSFGSPVSMLSLTAGTTFRPLFSQEKGEETSRLPSTSRECMYQLVQENNKHPTTTEELLESSNNTSRERDPTVVFGRNASHPIELQPGSLSSLLANHFDGWVANPRTTRSIHHPPIFPSPRQNLEPAFDSNTISGAFSREEIIDEIIHTFCSKD